MEVNFAFPAKTVPEFIAYAKANPGRINFGSPGIGTSNHISGELFKMLTGVDMIHVPYRATPAALTDLVSGQIQVMFDNMPTSIGYIRDGKLRPLAVTSATRWQGLPDIPTVRDFVPGFEASGVGGVGVPANTSIEIIEKLNKLTLPSPIRGSERSSPTLERLCLRFRPRNTDSSLPLKSRNGARS
jgi:tripartite-type tricarboxylate transporter receptor subunit TctC